MKMYLENKDTKRKFEIVRVDKETNELVLQGEVSQFREPRDPARFRRLGYELVKEEANGSE
jgi:hypothetical protein